MRSQILDPSANDVGRPAPEEDERLQRELVEALLDTATTLANTQDADAVLDRILANLGRVVSCDLISIMLVESGMARVVRSRGFSERGLKDLERDLRLKVEEVPVLRKVFATGRAAVIADTRAEPDWMQFPETNWIRAHVTAPLRVKSRVIGFLNVDRSIANSFTSADVRYLQVFADQAALALENAQLVAEAEQRAGESAALFEISRDLANQRDLPSLLLSIVKHATQLRGAASGSIYLYDLEQKALKLAVVHDRQLEPVAMHTRWDEDIASQVAQTRRPLVMNGTSEEDHSTLAVPMLYGGELVGVLVVMNVGTQARKFGEADAHLLSLLATQAASAVDNARQLDQRQDRIRELGALYKIAASINSTLDLDWVLDLTVQEIQDLLQVERCSLMLLDDKTNELVFRVSTETDPAGKKPIRISLDQGIAGWVALKGQPALVNDVRTDPRWYSQVDRTTGFVTRSILALPLKNRDKVIGVIEVINKVDGIFTEDHLRLLDSISMVVAEAIENARLFGELNEAYQETARTQNLILESRNTLRTLFDGIADSICIVDREMRVQAINRAASAETNEAPWNLVGRECHEVVCQSESTCDTCPIAKTLKTGKPMYVAQTRNGSLGASRELEVRTYPLRNGDEEVDRVIYIARDVSEQRRMEATLAQSAKLSAVGELAAGVAHEINNPLTAVIANAQMLLQALDPKDARYKSLQLIERAGLRANRVVRNLLDFSRQEKYQFAPTSIASSIDDALSLVAYQLERNHIRVAQNLPPDLPPVYASNSHLQTVWTNLLLNARDSLAKQPDGQIQITARPGKDGRSVQVLFADNGHGIAEKDLGKVFEPFFTTKSQGKGTGLGLYICYNIILQHRGTIRVRSQVGKGSTFVVTLPTGEAGKVGAGEEPA